MKSLLEKILKAEEVTTTGLVIRFILAFALMAAIFFGTASTLNWPGAWAYILLQLSISTAMTLWLKKHDPELMKSRMSFLKPRLQNRDKLFALLCTLLFIPYLLLPGLDAVRYGWSTVSLPVQLAGFTGFLCSMWLIFRVLQENSFASPNVEVQKERGHTVIDTSPYAYIRLPMYSGFIIYVICLPLALGSLWTMLIAILISLSLLIRIFFEEETLHAELEGYTAYCKRVRFRLIPGLW
jgi:protein-S-isoprenylcysteine O-methyltransferase Ste14